MNPQFSNMHDPADDERLFADLLAFRNGELDDPKRRAEIGELVEKDPRWKAHYESIKFIDLERAAAMQDMEDFEELAEQWGSGAAEPTDFCRSVAETNGGIFDPLIRGESDNDDRGRARDEWAPHLDECVYCRRMRRLAHARVQEEILGEPLLRDRLLSDLFSEMQSGVLQEAREVLVPVTAGELVTTAGQSPGQAIHLAAVEAHESLIIGNNNLATQEYLEPAYEAFGQFINWHAEPRKQTAMMETKPAAAISPVPARIADRSKLRRRPRGPITAFRLVRWSLPVTAATVVILSVALLGLLGAGYGVGHARGWFSGLNQARQSTHMDDYIEWAHRDPKTKEPYPFSVAGRLVTAKGRVRYGVIDKVLMMIREKGEEAWVVVDERAIEGKEFGEAVPFEVQYTAPTDNRIREVKVELIPSKEALDASPNDFPEELVKHKTHIICRPKGVIAYYPPGEPPVIPEQPRQYGQEWHVRLRTRTSTGFATIGVRDRGVGPYVVLPPQRVSYDDQELAFRLSPGGQADWFTITPFASEAGSANDLVGAIELHDFADTEKGEAVEVSVNPPGGTNVAHAQEGYVRIDGPTDGQAVKDSTDIKGKVSNPRVEVWVIVRPAGAAEYYVQPPIHVEASGMWSGMAYIRRHGLDSIKQFQIRAVANPRVELREGQVLLGWPEGEWSSEIITVARAKEVE